MCILKRIEQIVTAESSNDRIPVAIAARISPRRKERRKEKEKKKEREREPSKYGAIRNFLFRRVSPQMATPLNDRPVGRSVGPKPKHPPRTPYTERLSTRHAMLRRAALRRAAPRRAMPCRVAVRFAVPSSARVAWQVVSFLYSFVGKSAASLVFKRRQRGSGEQCGERGAARGRRRQKGNGGQLAGVAKRGSEGAGLWLGAAWVGARGRRRGARSPARRAVRW